MTSPNALGITPNAQYLAECAAYIRDNMKTAIQAVYNAGKKLYEVREVLKASGDYMAWLASDVGISHDTAQNYINVFERGYDATRLDGGKIPLRALYALVAPNADSDGRDEAFKFIASGGDIDHKSAYVYAHAPEYIRRAVQNNTLSMDDAHATTKAINSAALHPDAKQLCLTHNVHYAECVKWLDEKRKQTDATAHLSKPSTTFEDVADNGFLNMQSGGVSLMYARQRDIDKYMIERAAFFKHEASIQKWRWQPVMCSIVLDGSAVLLDLANVQGAFTEGQPILINIRLPVED